MFCTAYLHLKSWLAHTKIFQESSTRGQNGDFKISIKGRNNLWHCPLLYSHGKIWGVWEVLPLSERITCHLLPYKTNCKFSFPLPLNLIPSVSVSLFLLIILCFHYDNNAEGNFCVPVIHNKYIL